MELDDKLTWLDRGDLRLRIYDSNGNNVAEVDKSSWRNKVEEITIDLEPDDWQIAVKSDSKRSEINYTTDGVVEYQPVEDRIHKQYI